MFLIIHDHILCFIFDVLFFFSWHSHKNKSQELEKKIQEFESIKTNPGRALSNLSQYVHQVSLVALVLDLDEHMYTIFPACMHVPLCDKISSYSFAEYLTSCQV